MDGNVHLRSRHTQPEGEARRMRLLSKWSLLLQCSAAGMIRYTKKARRVVFSACEQAFQESSKEVTAEHLLVGLIRTDQFLAARCGLTIDQVRRELTKASHECRTATLILSHTATEAISLAAEEREHFGHKHTGTEHLLLESSVDVPMLRGC
jgi:ATP-dependent Clp protease ATP-binding subunit ClpA